MESYCEMCGDQDESLYHTSIIFLCPCAKHFWKEVKKVSGVATIPNLHPGTWMTGVLDVGICSAGTAEALVCGAWTLSTGRNGC